MNMNINLNGPKIRLLIALCLCFFLFVATTTTPSDGNGCSSAEENGSLLVINESNDYISFKCSVGKKNSRLREAFPGQSITLADLEPGFYTYMIVVWGGGVPTKILRGDVNILPSFQSKLTHK